MISPQEIKALAEKWWKPFLQSCITEQPFFPKTIDRIGKVNAQNIRERFGELQAELDALRKASKEVAGHGYVIKKEDVNFRRTGSHQLPQSIVFESAEDYVLFVGKEKEWKAFVKDSQLIRASIPDLTAWMIRHPFHVVDNSGSWEDLIAVCAYFLRIPRPNLYIRQLPLNLHTKFIERNENVLRLLLDYLIPDHIKDSTSKAIATRYYLKSDQPTVRLRILDTTLAIGQLTDIRIPVNDFNILQLSCDTVIVTENKMNFLALPALPSTIAIWSGGGFMISYLKNAVWLKGKKIIYWGDLDAHGFLMLHQMRSYFPQTMSIMMNIATFELFKNEGVVKGELVYANDLSLLTEDEKKAFIFLKENNFRLEQEKIRQEYSDQLLISLIR